MGIPASERLRKQSDFLGVRDAGLRLLCGPFIFQCLKRPEGCGRRVGIIASRRVGNAVRRNRCKRRLREIVRRHFARLPENCDLVLVVRASLHHHAHADLEARFLKACDRFAREAPPAPANPGERSSG